MELATSLAILSSGAYTTFWLLYHIYSDTSVLEAVREELVGITESDDNTTPKRQTLKTNKVKTGCPTLVALFYETLRFHGNVMSVKSVKEETTRSGKFCFKKGAHLLIPSQSLHLNEDTWGPDASTFDHRRFTHHGGIKNSKNTGAFRPFGSGANTCPGRHFASNVILSLTAVIVSRYNLHCTWFKPGPGAWEPWNSVTRPDRDFDVRVSRSTCSEGVEWNVIWDTNHT